MALALVAAALTLAPSDFYSQHLLLIDHDDSIHRLGPKQIAVLKLGFAGVAGLAAVCALLLASYRNIAQRAAGVFAEDARRVAHELAEALDLRKAGIKGTLFVLFLIGFAVRALLLDGPMRFDEAYTFDYFASRGFFSLATDYTAPNNHILHTILVRISYLLFGDAPPALRLPALLAGLAVMPLTYILGVRLFDRKTATLAVALAAAHPGLVAYSANARGYSLVVALTLIAWVAASFLCRRRSISAWVVLTAAGSLGMFTIPTMIYPLVAISIWALWSASADRRPGLVRDTALAAIVVAAASLAFYAPAAARTGIKGLVANPYVTSLDWAEMATKLPGLFEGGWLLSTDHIVASWLLAIVAAAGLLARPARMLTLATVFGACFLMAAQAVVPPSRVFLYAAPIGCLLTAAGLRQIAGRLPIGSTRFETTGIAIALAVLLALSHTVGHFWFPTRLERFRRECDRVGEELARRVAPGEGVLAAVPLSEPIRYALLRQGRPRGLVLAPDVYSGALPVVDNRASLFVVRVRLGVEPDYHGFGSSVDLEDPVFRVFSAPKSVLAMDFLEVVRLERDNID